MVKVLVDDFKLVYLFVIADFVVEAHVRPMYDVIFSCLSGSVLETTYFHQQTNTFLPSAMTGFAPCIVRRAIFYVFLLNFSYF